MDPKTQISSVALFYYYAFLDEKVGLYATLRTWDKLKSSLLPKQKVSREWWQNFVVQTSDGYRRHQKLTAPAVSLPEELHPQILYHQNVDLGPWREFRKRVGSDEFLAVLWTQILQIPEEDVARALRISLGTLKHRLSRGLRKLGESGSGARL